MVEITCRDGLSTILVRGSRAKLVRAGNTGYHDVMCGRFTLATPAEIVAEFFDLAEIPELAPRYNIAPTQNVAAVVVSRETGRREMRFFHWGLILSSATEPGTTARTINARAETVAEKPAYRAAFRARRCLIIADGFYEWKKAAAGKQPYHIRMADGRPFGFAGVWEPGKTVAGRPIDSCSVITGEPNGLVRDIHDRMPVILHAADYGAWLDPQDENIAKLLGMLRPYPAENMRAVPVSARVNTAANDDPGCIQPVQPPAQQTLW